MQGIADALMQLTSLNVIVEDVFGNPRAWSGERSPIRTGGSAATTARRRFVALPLMARRSATALGSSGSSGRRRTSLGWCSCTIRKRVADRLDIVALEHAATVLALEFAHHRVLAETELRLGRDLVEDLLAGTDDECPSARRCPRSQPSRAKHRDRAAMAAWSRG